MQERNEWALECSSLDECEPCKYRKQKPGQTDAAQSVKPAGRGGGVAFIYYQDEDYMPGDSNVSG